MKNKIIENLESKNKTLKYTLNIEKSEISKNNFGLKFIGNIAKNSLRSEFKEKILEDIQNEKKYFEENVSLKINDFIGIKKGKEFEVLCDLIFQKSTISGEFFLDKENISEFKNDYFITFPNRLISISPVFGIKNSEDVKRFFLELRKFFLLEKNNSEKIFYEKILEILEKNIGENFLEKSEFEILEFFGEVISDTSNNENEILENYKNMILYNLKKLSVGRMFG